MKSRCFLTAGILNLILMAFVFVFAILMVICVALGIVLSFTIFIIGALPLAVICGILAGLSFFAVFLMFVTGLGAVLSYCRGWKLACPFAVASLIVDALYLLPASVAVVFTAISLAEDPASSVGAFLLVLLTVALAVAGIITNAVGLKKRK